MASVNSDAQTWIRAYQISRTQNFRSEGHRRLRPRSRSGPRPCPHPCALARSSTSATHHLARARNTGPPQPHPENSMNALPRGRYKYRHFYPSPPLVVGAWQTEGRREQVDNFSRRECPGR